VFCIKLILIQDHLIFYRKVDISFQNNNNNKDNNKIINTIVINMTVCFYIYVFILLNSIFIRKRI